MGIDWGVGCGVWGVRGGIRLGLGGGLRVLIPSLINSIISCCFNGADRGLVEKNRWTTEDKSIILILCLHTVSPTFFLPYIV